MYYGLFQNLWKIHEINVGDIELGDLVCAKTAEDVRLKTRDMEYLIACHGRQ